MKRFEGGFRKRPFRRERGRSATMYGAIARGFGRLAAALALVSAPAPLPAQGVRGVLIESTCGAPIEGALVVLVTPTGEDHGGTRTDGSGGFSILAPATGRFRLRAEWMGQVMATTPILDLMLDDLLQYRMEIQVEPVLRQRILQDTGRRCVVDAAEPGAIPLAPLTVRGESREAIEARRSGSRVDVLTRREIEGIQAARHAGDLVRGIPELRVREGGGAGIPSGVCVESERVLRRPWSEVGEPGRSWCSRMVQVYLNGSPIVDGASFLRTLRPDEIERLEYLNPIEARARFGPRGRFGALVIETRLTGD